MPKLGTYKGSPGKKGKNLSAPKSAKTKRVKDTKIRVTSSAGMVDKKPGKVMKRIF